MTRCTILLNSDTREKLKAIGRKGQTYDDLLIELINAWEAQRVQIGNLEK